ncbi:MAG: hypothetical protein AB1505_10975 [Candidatus Latescibacterota bacterium]
MEDKRKLQVLLEHWIEHNAAHEKELAAWVERARGAGLEDASRQIAGAADRLAEAARALQRALDQLGAGGERNAHVSE